MNLNTEREAGGGWKGQETLHRWLFRGETKEGRLLELVLLGAIVLSVGTVMLESMESFRAAHGRLLGVAEWLFTLLFTVEYGLRLASVRRPFRYATSFFGIVDFIAVVPTYLALLVLSSNYFLVVRILRLVRVFRILKLGRYVQAGNTIWLALQASRQKITVFLMAVVSLVVLVGTLMYLIEGPEAGFHSIPAGIYWAIVTLTTVGYGDLTPISIPGRMLASVVMILGYSIIAVPTGIVTVELGRARESERGPERTCPGCGVSGHAAEAAYCKACGGKL